jgi:hypothetical protein
MSTIAGGQSDDAGVCHPQEAGFVAGVPGLGSSVALVGLLIAVSRVPTAVAQRRVPKRDRYVIRAVRSWRGRGRPEKAGELARDGDRRDVGGLAARLEALVDAVQAMLRLPRDPQDVLGLTVVAAEQGLTDPGVARVVPGRLDQQAAGDARPGHGDRPLGLALTRLIKRRGQSQPARELSRRGEPVPVAAELEMQGQRGERVDSAKRPES